MDPSGDITIAQGTDPPVSATCPRCGYDQSGAIATWVDRCPLQGVCPECGLDFEWARVVRRTRDPLAWSFEHAPRAEGEELPAALRAFATTVGLCLTPWRLWRRMRMEYPIHAKRVGILVVAAVVLLTLALIVARDAVTLIDILSWQTLDTIVHFNSRQWSDIFSQLLVFGASPRDVVPAALWWTIWWFLVPPLFLLLPHSLRRAKVRNAHLVRIFLYSLVLLPLALGALQVPRTALILADFSYHTTRAEQSIIWGAVVLLQVLFFGSLLAFFWSRACRHYLKLPNSFAIGAALSIVALLVTLAIYVIPIALGLVESVRAWPETT